MVDQDDTVEVRKFLNRRFLPATVCSADPLDAVQVAVAINLSPEEVPWESSPEGTEWLANELRHFSSDGRLGFWIPAQVCRALLEWIPEKVTAPEEDLLDAPETLRSLQARSGNSPGCR